MDRDRPDDLERALALCARAHTNEATARTSAAGRHELGVCSSQLPGASREQSRESSRPPRAAPSGAIRHIYPFQGPGGLHEHPRIGAEDHDTRGAVAPRTHIRRLSTETKAAFKTTEFFSYIAVLVGVLIAGAVVDSADAGGYGARQVWLYATILTVGYMVSRGLAKSGSSDPYDADNSNR
jgi:hypothetical protein